MDHAEVMNACDAKAQRIGLARLTSIERVVVLVSRANFEIELGGLDAFYYNSAGDEAVATVAALEAVGATHAASTLREANDLFPGGAAGTLSGEALLFELAMLRRIYLFTIGFMELKTTLWSFHSMSDCCHDSRQCKP